MNNCSIKNKKILFFAPAFFGYENLIKQKYEELGAEVDFFDERSVKSAWERALLKISPSIFSKKSERYFNRIIDNNLRESYDYILIIKAEMMSAKVLKWLKEKYNNSKLCLYLYDSIKNIPNILEKIEIFDICSSFDRKDCLKHRKLKFRPLFFCDDFKEVSDINTTCIYDISFCGTIHSDRYSIISKIESQCKKFNLNFYSFNYLQSYFIYYFYKIFNRSFWNAKLNNFSFEKLSQSKIADIENNSKAVLDIQHPGQNGLTMRTIELIGLGKKIITTNEDIVNYDFYNDSNILVINRNNPVINKEFLTKPYVHLTKSISNKYSLKQWALDVIGLGEFK